MTSRSLPAFLVLALSGCAGEFAHQQGIDLFAQGKQEEGLVKLEQAAREAPDNQVYLIAWRNALARISGRLLAEAQRQRNAGQFDAAAESYRRLLRLDPDNAEARAGLAALDQQRAHAVILVEAKALFDANDLEGARSRVDEVLRADPRQPQARALRQAIGEKSGREESVTPALRKSFQKPVTLEFRDASLKQVLEALSVHSGLNFVLDKDVPPNLTVTAFLRNVSVADAVDLIAATRQLRSRILNDTSVLIYPDTPPKQLDHQELVVRNFFLANAEAKQVLAMLKTVLKAKTVFADDKLNLIVMRDTPAMIALAERLVTAQDVSEPEVMLELAVVEITRSRLTSIGLQLPNQLTLSPLPSNTTTGLTLTDLKNLNSDKLGAVIAPTIINLQDDNNGENLLANPRIRTHSREKAVIRIGDRVPVITTTATSTGFVSENVQYLDVGLKLEVEPVVFPDDEISIKLGLEVSNVIAQVTSSAGTVAYQVGGRNAGTVLRLKDGETQVLGGLINDDDVRSANRFPGLSKLPILGRLFSNETKNNQKRELVLFITPRIVRGLVPSIAVPAKFWSGTENSPRLRPAVEALPPPTGKVPVLTAPPAVPAPPPGSVGSVASPAAPVSGPAPAGPVPTPELQPDQPMPGGAPPGAGPGVPAVPVPAPATPAPAATPLPPTVPPSPPAPASAPASAYEAQPAPGLVQPQFGAALSAPPNPPPAPVPAMPPLEPQQP